jgi:hypothetical protein
MTESRTVRRVTASGTEIWWDRNDPTRIMHTTQSPVFHDASGGSPGLWWTACSNRASADYHPGNFNRMRLALLDAGLDAPPPCPPGDRRLRSRGNGMSDRAIVS